MRLILLGAGASYGASRFGSIRPPMVTGILPGAVELGMFSPDYASLRHKAVANMMRESGALPAFVEKFEKAGNQHLKPLTDFIEEQFDCLPVGYRSAQIDFERLFALTESSLLGQHAMLRHLKQVPEDAMTADQLDMQIKLVLCGTLIAATRDIRCDFHDALAAWLSPGDLIVSFNYDLLIDRSLFATGTWFHDDGYGLEFKQHLHRDGEEVTWRDPTPTNSNYKLIKPHGSLNWLYPRNAWDSVMNVSLQPSKSIRQAPPFLYCLDDVHAQFEDDYPTYEWWERYDIDHDDMVFDLHSLIVPPTLSKPYRSFENYMGPLWGAFITGLLRDVDEMFLIGYSLRPDDLRTHWLMRKAARDGAKLKRVSVIDPSATVLDRAAQLFAPLKVECPCHTIGEFAELISRKVV